VEKLYKPFFIKLIMMNETGQNNFRKLIYFSENKIKVHFKDLDNIFYNGLILDLNEIKLTLILQERVRGIIPFLLEQIQTHSIQEFKEIGE